MDRLVRSDAVKTMGFVFVIKLQLKSVGGQVWIAFLHGESHWSAQDPFYFFRWFCFQVVGEAFLPTKSTSLPKCSVSSVCARRCRSDR